MNKKGMTLLEVIIALFVFAVGILAVVRVITTNISLIDTMKTKIEAESLAKE
jgi:prepilin-type N-terminal cleavage/methylation domain-containing protein